VLRSDESLKEKCEYIRQNPVRRGLVVRPEEYRWSWVNPQWMERPNSFFWRTGRFLESGTVGIRVRGRPRHIQTFKRLPSVFLSSRHK
jgi:hypothetical protein